MTDFMIDPHPIAAEMQFVSEAMLQGAADEIPYWGLLRGVEVEYLDSTQTEEGVSYLKIEKPDSVTIEYMFKPPVNVENPLTVIESDGTILPVHARLLVSFSRPPYLTLKRVNKYYTMAHSAQVDVVDAGALLTASGSAELEPIVGEFDSQSYQLIRSKVYNDLRFGQVLRFARDFVS